MQNHRGNLSMQNLIGNVTVQNLRCIVRVQNLAGDRVAGTKAVCPGEAGKKAQ